MDVWHCVFRQTSVPGEHVNATHDGTHVLSYDSVGWDGKNGGAAHSPRTSAAFTLNPGLPRHLCFSPLPHTSRGQSWGFFFIFFLLTAFLFFFFFFLDRVLWNLSPLAPNLLRNSTSFTVRNTKTPLKVAAVTLGRVSVYISADSILTISPLL